ncbi:MAG: LLM class F420-dependent oxidoreductase [Acidobacteria bacterium]|nr:LLM class F420-dependent oxidoreductase [Acidobacteriota bacterium]
MLYGAMMFATDYAIRPDELARELEERGFESMWVPEHTHIPASRRTPYPGGGDLPREYWHSYDPFIALTAAAAVTKRIRLGTGICLMIERDPIITAKEVASLDMLSNGRFIFGIGGGWNAEEMENHGTNYKKRWKILRERILAMKEIWTKEEAEYHGEFVNFDPIWSHPKPVQKPHPPILMGGYGPTTFDRVVEYCDGWFPIGLMAGNIEEKIAELKQKAESAGRDPNTISVTVALPQPDQNVVDRMESAGVERVIFILPSAQRDKVMPVLDKYSELIPQGEKITK